MSGFITSSRYSGNLKEASGNSPRNPSPFITYGGFHGRKKNQIGSSDSRYGLDHQQDKNRYASLLRVYMCLQIL